MYNILCFVQQGSFALQLIYTFNLCVQWNSHTIHNAHIELKAHRCYLVRQALLSLYSTVRCSVYTILNRQFYTAFYRFCAYHTRMTSHTISLVLPNGLDAYHWVCRWRKNYNQLTNDILHRRSNTTRGLFLLGVKKPADVRCFSRFLCFSLALVSFFLEKKSFRLQSEWFAFFVGLMRWKCTLSNLIFPIHDGRNWITQPTCKMSIFRERMHFDNGK